MGRLVGGGGRGGEGCVEESKLRPREFELWKSAPVDHALGSL
jgi:hypothetical protein